MLNSAGVRGYSYLQGSWWFFGSRGVRPDDVIWEEENAIYLHPEKADTESR